MRIDQELACDEAVVSRFPEARRAYAEVLLKAQLAVLPLPVGCYWPSRSQHPLVERIAMLKRRRIGRVRRWIGAAALAPLFAGAGLAVWASQPAQMRTMFAAAPASAAVQAAVVAAGDVGTPAAHARPARTGKGAAAAATGGVVRSILVLGNRQVDVGTILSRLTIARGQTVTPATLAAGEKALRDTGLFDDVGVTLDGGDLQVWVSERRPGIPGIFNDPALQSTPVVTAEGYPLSTDQLRQRMRQLAMARGVQVTDDKIFGLEAEALHSLVEDRRRMQAAERGGSPPAQLVAPSPLAAAAAPISVSADRMETFHDARMTRFSGNVQVVGDLTRAFEHAPVQSNGIWAPGASQMTRMLVADDVEFWRAPSGELEAVIVNGLRYAE
jgi:hypothetical protein